jgi:hypothetical protein
MGDPTIETCAVEVAVGGLNHSGSHTIDQRGVEAVQGGEQTLRSDFETVPQPRGGQIKKSLGPPYDVVP